MTEKSESASKESATKTKMENPYEPIVLTKQQIEQKERLQAVLKV